MAFYHLSVFSRCLWLELRANAVEPLGNFFARQTTLAVGDEDSHGTMLSNPSGDDCLNDTRGSLVRHRYGRSPPDSFVEQVTDDIAAYE